MTLQLIKPFGARLTPVLDGFLKVHGNILMVAQEANGWIRLAMTTTSQQLICGDALSVNVILG